MTNTCTACNQTIPAGEAVCRTRSFVQVAWHRACYDATHAAPSIPAQRTGDHDAISLVERIAARVSA